VSGSSATNTVVEFKNNFDPQVNLAIYAPKSTVSLENNTFLVGAVAAGQILLKNNAKVVTDSRTGGIGPQVTDPVLRRQGWTECTVNGGATPDAGC
jgi:hypothetical protein